MVPAVPACLLGAALTPLPGLGPVVDWEKQLVVVLLDRQCWVHRDQSKERWEQLQLLVEMGRDLVALLHATCKWSEKKSWNSRELRNFVQEENLFKPMVEVTIAMLHDLRSPTCLD